MVLFKKTFSGLIRKRRSATKRLPRHQVVSSWRVSPDFRVLRDIEEAELLVGSLSDQILKRSEAAIIGHIPIDETRLEELLRD